MITYIPDGTQEQAAISRTTHLAISAHQDDIEFMAYAPIAECFGNQDKWFGAIVVTDGAGSPRSGLYADYTDEQMKKVRIVEQKKAACVGEYGFLAMLSHPSKEVKDAGNPKIVEELADLIRRAKPKYLYTHNLADKHETHVATALQGDCGIAHAQARGAPRKGVRVRGVARSGLALRRRKGVPRLRGAPQPDALSFGGVRQPDRRAASGTI